MLAAAFMVVPGPSIDLTVRDVRLRDIIRTTNGKAIGGACGAIVVARLAPGPGVTVMTRTAAAGLVRRAVPRISLHPTPGKPLLLRLAGAKLAYPFRNCHAVSAPIAATKAIDRLVLTPSPCSATQPPSVVRFGPDDGALHAIADLAPGTMIGRVWLPALADVQPGTRLTLVSDAGPVRIQRMVTAVQSGRAGRRIFIKDGDGDVFAVPLDVAQRMRP